MGFKIFLCIQNREKEKKYFLKKFICFRFYPENLHHITVLNNWTGHWPWLMCREIFTLHCWKTLCKSKLIKKIVVRLLSDNCTHQHSRTLLTLPSWHHYQWHPRQHPCQHCVVFHALINRFKCF